MSSKLSIGGRASKSSKTMVPPHTTYLAQFRYIVVFLVGFLKLHQNIKISTVRICPSLRSLQSTCRATVPDPVAVCGRRSRVLKLTDSSWRSKVRLVIPSAICFFPLWFTTPMFFWFTSQQHLYPKYVELGHSTVDTNNSNNYIYTQTRHCRCTMLTRHCARFLFGHKAESCCAMKRRCNWCFEDGACTFPAPQLAIWRKNGALAVGKPSKTGNS